MNILGVIPARGGSKSIPRKNVALIAGRPLLAYTCEAALHSKRLTRTILSTEDKEIAAVGRACGVDVPFLRPPILAQDETTMIDVLQHALTYLTEVEGYQVDLVVLLQPTSPLRRTEHIDSAVDLLIDTGAETVVSVVQVPHQFNPSSLLQIDKNGMLIPYLDQPMVLRRQDKPQFYARNGPAVLVVRREVLERSELYGSSVRPYEMSPGDSLDIDDIDDLQLAEFWLGRRGNNKMANSE